MNINIHSIPNIVKYVCVFMCSQYCEHVYILLMNKIRNFMCIFLLLFIYVKI